MPTQGKPTVVLVQGSFQARMVYQAVRMGLMEYAYPAVHPLLPSCINPEAPDFADRTLVGDALAVRSELIRLVEYESKKVVVVMHAYGGLVGSEAVAEDLSYRYRQSKKLPGGVIHLFYYSAFILPAGRCILDAFGESHHNDVKPDGRFTIHRAAKVLYNDLPPSKAGLWGDRIIMQSYKVQETKLTREAYRYVPSTYLICDNDQVSSPQVQEALAKTAGSRIEHCNAGHSPHLSQPGALVKTIIRVIEDAVASLTTREGMPPPSGDNPQGGGNPPLCGQSRGGGKPQNGGNPQSGGRPQNA